MIRLAAASATAGETTERQGEHSGNYTPAPTPVIPVPITAAIHIPGNTAPVTLVPGSGHLLTAYRTQP